MNEILERAYASAFTPFLAAIILSTAAIARFAYLP